MLDVVRKHASSWIIKFLLGVVIIVFVFFFGSSALRNPEQSGSDLAAQVNGEPISQGQVVGLFNLQKESNPEIANLPESLLKIYQANIVNSLVQGKLVWQKADQAGLRVSNGELAQAIIGNSSFQINGTFNRQFYENKFIPSFERRYGMDYENFLRQGLIEQKFHNLFNRSIYISDESLKEYYILENTKLSFKKVIVQPFTLSRDFNPSDEEIKKWVAAKKETLTTKDSMDEAVLAEEAKRELKLEEGKKKAEILSGQLWPLFQADRLTKEELEKNDLTEDELKDVSLSELEQVLGGQDNPEQELVLARLTAEKPYPLNPIEAGNTIYFIKLIQRNTPKPEDFAVWKEKKKENLNDELSNLFFERWYTAEADKAKIKIYSK